MIYKALTIKQPWADLIADGSKTFEVRSWGTRYRGPLLIVVKAKPVTPHAGHAIVLVDLIDVRRMKRADADAAHVPFHRAAMVWELANARRIIPVPVRSHRRIFGVNLPTAVTEKVRTGIMATKKAPKKVVKITKKTAKKAAKKSDKPTAPESMKEWVQRKIVDEVDKSATTRVAILECGHTRSVLKTPRNTLRCLSCTLNKPKVPVAQAVRDVKKKLADKKAASKTAPKKAAPKKPAPKKAEPVKVKASKKAA